MEFISLCLVFQIYINLLTNAKTQQTVILKPEDTYRAKNVNVEQFLNVLAVHIHKYLIIK